MLVSPKCDFNVLLQESQWAAFNPNFVHLGIWPDAWTTLGYLHGKVYSLHVHFVFYWRKFSNYMYAKPLQLYDLCVSTCFYSSCHLLWFVSSYSVHTVCGVLNWLKIVNVKCKQVIVDLHVNFPGRITFQKQVPESFHTIIGKVCMRALSRFL